jgi:hypothetical protein
MRYLPYFKGTLFPFYHYNPAEKQPFEQLKYLSPDIPIIIVHCAQDRITPFEGAEIAYYQLISNGHTQTYLLKINKRSLSLSKKLDAEHINIISHNSQQEFDLKKLLESILNNENIMQLSRYQPDVTNYAKKSQRLYATEQHIKRLGLLFKTLKYIILLYALYKTPSYMNYLYKKFKITLETL